MANQKLTEEVLISLLSNEMVFPYAKCFRPKTYKQPPKLYIDKLELQPTQKVQIMEKESRVGFIRVMHGTVSSPKVVFAVNYETFTGEVIEAAYTPQVLYHSGATFANDSMPFCSKYQPTPQPHPYWPGVSLPVYSISFTPAPSTAPLYGYSEAYLQNLDTSPCIVYGVWIQLSLLIGKYIDKFDELLASAGL